MERFLLYLDDLDDLYGAARLKAEAIRRHLLRIIALLVALAAGTGGIVLAIAKPPLALAALVLLSSIGLYRSVTGRMPARPAAGP